MRRMLLLLSLACLYVACLYQCSPHVDTHQTSTPPVIKVF